MMNQEDTIVNEINEKMFNIKMTTIGFLILWGWPDYGEQTVQIDCPKDDGSTDHYIYFSDGVYCSFIDPQLY